VVTSGIEGIYPKGFVVGQIESIDRQAGQFSNVVVRPAVDFSELETVLVVVTPPAGEAQ
jgi:rod shape-determining protein MreC